MILVLLGTNPYPFDRLMMAMSLYARNTGTKVIAQSGNTPSRPDIECYPFVDHSQLIKWISEADVVVCQGGFGSLSDCIARGAKTVAVPRRMSLGESMDDQEELVRAFAEEGLVVPVYDVSDLPRAIELAETIERSPPAPSKLPAHIAETIRAMSREFRQ